MHIDTGLAHLSVPTVEVNSHPSEQEEDAGASDPTTAVCVPEVGVKTPKPPDDPEAGKGTRQMAPVHSSTPKPSQPSWSEVMHWGWKRDPIEGRASLPVPLTA